MSIWTHVVGNIRVDALSFGALPKKAELNKIFHSRAFKLPCGSEGGLDFKVVIYNKEGNVPWATVPVWGDLRDYSDTEYIKKWWSSVINVINADGCFSVRDAVLLVEVEGYRPFTLYSR
jgi:hypothetical protein